MVNLSKSNTLGAAFVSWEDPDSSASETSDRELVEEDDRLEEKLDEGTAGPFFRLRFVFKDCGGWLSVANLGVKELDGRGRL